MSAPVFGNSTNVNAADDKSQPLLTGVAADKSASASKPDAQKKPAPATKSVDTIEKFDADAFAWASGRAFF